MDPHQTKIYTAILISSLLLGIIIVFFFISLVRHQKRIFDMSRKNLLAELTLLEKEHTRIAQDMHDELGPILTAVKFNISSLEVSESEGYIAERATEQIDLAIQRIREVSRDLMPAALTRHSLKEALEELIAAMPSSPQIKLVYRATQAIGADKSLQIYRLLKEILQNAIKHAEARNLVIQVEEKGKALAIVCEDDGKGFDYKSKLSQSEGLGLRSLKSRVELLGGRLEVHSVRFRGTQLKIDVPLPSSKPDG